MTKATVNAVVDSPELTNFCVRVLTTVLVIIALSLSFAGLRWAVKNKLSQYQPVSESQITAKVRERQLACLARNIYYEAGSEPFEGKVAVAQVTLNRMESGKFPEDICQVIYQKNIFYEKVVCQFSWYCDREATIRPIHKGNYDESMEAAKKVLLEGFRLPSIKDALFYHADYVNPQWKKPVAAKIGRHIFYKPREI